MSVHLFNFLFYIFPTIIFVIALIGIGWSVRKSKRYLIGYILLLLGAGTHNYGLLIVRAWDGMAISLFLGGGSILLGLLVLFITLIYTKLAAKLV
ncbi:hypothetical protein [Sporosarcina sp. FSL K6-3508]|uniref:hypothetical protein n=1 Tax=Sporosarcina sp. FSL K6-3508 TaxID=2921557 RepID=UPI00315A27DD